MPERERPQLPDWAEQERAGDLAWIKDNLHIFLPAARLGYESVGRGAIVVDTTFQPAPDQGHPFGYFDKLALEQSGDEDTQRMVHEYDPTGEYVTVLLKTGQRSSSYRIRIVPGKSGNNQTE